jgi:hypothetical protein
LRATSSTNTATSTFSQLASATTQVRHAAAHCLLCLGGSSSALLQRL